LNAVIVENCTLAFCFGPDAHPVIVQVPHCRAEILRPYFYEFQRPNWSFCFVRLRVSPNNEEKRAKKETCKYASFHGFTSRVSEKYFK